MRFSGLSIMVMLVGVIATMGIQSAESATSSNANFTISDNVTANHLSNKTMTNMTMPSMTNKTMTNMTMPSMTKAEIKKQVSDFLAVAIPLFKQQRTETIQEIRDCQNQRQNSSPDNMAQVNDQCNMKLNDINAKYKEQRAELQSFIKDHRNITLSLLSSQIAMVYS